MNAAIDHFNNYLREHRIKHSSPRELVFNVFIECERHVTINDLVKLVQAKHPSVGTTTVYRTVKLICDAGIAREIDFGEGIVRYEHDFGHEHHDHLVCIKCGKFVEIHSEAIESTQEKIAKKNQFKLTGHKLVLYGICSDCG